MFLHHAQQWYSWYGAMAAVVFMGVLYAGVMHVELSDYFAELGSVQHQTNASANFGINNFSNVPSSPTVSPLPVTIPDPARAPSSAVPLSVAPSVPSTQPPAHLLTASDVVYKGAFALPNEGGGDSRFAYGGRAAAYNPANNSLFVSGHDHHQLVAEITVPPPRVTTDASSLPVSSFLQSFTDVTEGKADTIPDSKLGGLLVSGGKLLWSVYRYYNVEGKQHASHGFSNTLFSNLNSTGLWHLGDFHIQRVAGYLAEIPASWQSAFGFRFLSGASSLSGRSASSDGPAAFGFSLWQAGSTLPPVSAPLQSNDFLWYDVEGKRATYEHEGVAHTWKGANTVGGMAFLVSGSGTRSALAYLVALGTYPEDWYGEPEDFPGLTCEGGKGYHAGPFVVELWLYDPQALLAVGRGEKNPWDVLPYSRINLASAFFNEACGLVGGVAYNVQARTLYLIERKVYESGPYESTPVVHVYQIN